MIKRNILWIYTFSIMCFFGFGIPLILGYAKDASKYVLSVFIFMFLGLGFVFLTVWIYELIINKQSKP